MKDPDLFSILFTGIWCLVGAVFVCVGLGLRRSWRRREERLRARASGTVTELVRRESHSSDGTSVSWYPIVEFECDGRTISLESDSGGGRKRYYEGQSVEVLYDPDDPTCFRLERDGTGPLIASIMLAVGLGCIAIGLAAGGAIRAFSGHIGLH